MVDPNTERRGICKRRSDKHEPVSGMGLQIHCDCIDEERLVLKQARPVDGRAERACDRHDHRFDRVGRPCEPMIGKGAR